MTEKKLEKFSTTAIAVLTATAMSIPTSARAEDGAKIDLSPDTPAEQLVEWRGADSPNLIDSRIDRTRRNLRITATTNTPVSLHGACPPQDLYPNWKLDLGKKGTNKGYPAEVHDRDTLRTGPNGTWTLDTTAPSRPNQKLQTTLTCYHDADNNNARDKGEDSQKLTAFITSQGDGGSSGTGNFFTFSGEGPESFDDSDSSSDSSKEGHRVKMEGNVVGFLPRNEGDFGYGFEARVGWNPINSIQHLTVGALYRYVDITETKNFRNTDTHTVAARAGWNPVWATRFTDIGIDLGVGTGLSNTQQEFLLKDGRKAPDAINPIAIFDAGVEFGNKNIRGKIGGLYTFSQHPLQEGISGTGGVKIEW